MEAGVPAREQDVDSGVDVSIMQDTTTITSPFSHSQTLRASRRACAGTATGTGLGAVSLVSIDIPGPVPNGLVAEHRAERGPAGIENGLRHSSAGKGRAIHIANANQGVLPGYARRGLVQEVPALRGNLPIDLADERLPAGALRTSQCLGKLGQMARVGNLLSAGENRHILQAKVDTDFSTAGRQLIGEIADQIEIPATRPVFIERSGTYVRGDVASLPESIAATQKYHGISIHLDRPITLERHPSERTLGAATGSPLRPPLRRVAVHRELLTDGGHGITVKTEHLRRAGGEPNQIKTRWPATVQSQAIILNAPAVIPNLIYRGRHAHQMLADGGVLDAELQGEKHPKRIFGLHYKRQIDQPSGHPQ